MSTASPEEDVPVYATEAEAEFKRLNLLSGLTSFGGGDVRPSTPSSPPDKEKVMSISISNEVKMLQLVDWIGDELLFS